MTIVVSNNCWVIVSRTIRPRWIRSGEHECVRMTSDDDINLRASILSDFIINLNSAVRQHDDYIHTLSFQLGRLFTYSQYFINEFQISCLCDCLQ